MNKTFVAEAVEDHARNGIEVKNDGTKTKQDSSFEKVKRAAVSTLAAAAVKAKLLANQEEDQIRQLTSLLIEKQVILWPGKALTAFYLYILYSFDFLCKFHQLAAI
jgi:hypothetical protein